MPALVECNVQYRLRVCGVLNLTSATQNEAKALFMRARTRQSNRAQAVPQTFRRKGM